MSLHVDCRPGLCLSLTLSYGFETALYSPLETAKKPASGHELCSNPSLRIPVKKVQGHECQSYYVYPHLYRGKRRQMEDIPTTYRRPKAKDQTKPSIYFVSFLGAAKEASLATRAFNLISFKCRIIRYALQR